MPMNYTSLLRKGSFLFVVGFLSSCSNWHVAPSVASSSDPVSVAVPYVTGDDSGELTAGIINAVNSQPSFQVNDDGRYVLKAILLDDKEEKIGYRYDPRALKRGKEKLILSETRAKALLQITLIERASKKTIAGPAYILGNIEYDHQENTIDNNINKLSLGQLSDIDTAEDVTCIPLYRDLSNKVALWLQNQKDLQK